MTTIDPGRLVFVAGLHRSGTTALAKVLAQHPDISGFSGTSAKEDEGQHLQDVYPPARTYGGAGRFARDPRAHLTETSDLVTPANAARLLEQWAPHWDLDRHLLIEKSPPNLLMTRMLQGLYPGSRFVVIVRHPVVVSLATQRWRRGRRFRTTFEHWFQAHELFADDRPHLEHVHVVKYEHLLADPRARLDEIGAFLGLAEPIPADGLEGGRSSGYATHWAAMGRDRLPWRRLERAGLVRDFGTQAARFGYDLEDLDDIGPWPSP